MVLSKNEVKGNAAADSAAESATTENVVAENATKKNTQIFVADEYASAYDLVDDIRETGVVAIAFTELSTLRQALSEAQEALLFLGSAFDPVNDCLKLTGALKLDALNHRRRLVVILVTPETDTKLVMEAAKVGVFRTMKRAVNTGLLKIIIADAIAEIDLIDLDPEPVTDDSPLDHVSESGKVKKEDDDPYVSKDGVSDGHRYPMERMIVLNNIPDEPGIITFYDEEEHPLMVEWAGNLNQRLNYYVDLHPGLSDVAKKARTFDVLCTMDQTQESKIFDRLTNKFSKFPLLMKQAPFGSAHYGLKPEAVHQDDTDGGRITQYTHTEDTKMLDGIKSLLAKDPKDPETQDWLAFTLYSNNLLDEAIEWYTRLITQGSRREEHFFYCGNAFFKKGNKDKALKLWKVSAKLRPDGSIAKKSLLRIQEVQDK